MSLNSESVRKDQIEFVFDLTFDKILHIPKRATEVQILWTKGKRTGSSSTAKVTANTATWGADGVKSIKIVSSLWKDPSSSSFLHKSLILEVVALQNRKITSTLSYCTLNLADYVSSIFDINLPSATMQIHEKMARGCIACIGVTAQFRRAKFGEWQPAEGISYHCRKQAHDEQTRVVANSSSSTAAPANIEKQDVQLKFHKASSKNVKLMGPVDEKSGSMYIGDASIELLLRIFSKYDCDRSGQFKIEQVASMLSEIGQTSVADDLRTGKAALSQNLDIFSNSKGVFEGTLDMTFSSFVSWIAANHLASKLHVVRSITKQLKDENLD